MEWARAAHYDARELARLCRVSLRQLQREFSRSLGRSPQEWLNEQRLRAARPLLLRGEPIKKVALELGFKQPSHFYRQFKCLYRMTPSEFVTSVLQARDVADGYKMSPADTRLKFSSFRGDESLNSNSA
jgi:AraC-like DNA-binding protein